MVFGDSKGSFSHITQSSDLDIDDAYARQAARRSTPRTKPITAIQKGVSVSQSSLSFDLWEKDVDQSIGFGVTRNTYTASQQVF